jgi:hypothetical protein
MAGVGFSSDDIGGDWKIPLSSSARPNILDILPPNAAARPCSMPLDLTDLELETAARACRALAHVERESAEKISDPALRGSVQQRAQCAAAKRFEAAWKLRKP